MEISDDGKYFTYAFNLVSDYFSNYDMELKFYGRTKDGVWAHWCI